ncbi:GNAT family N-acetyltransferase [Microscilla marina]|uniref:Acetyltransferase, gnat family n=1 Tax=Microscilla marina ATCC 23134 TaxID=313606 RepID=A1ZCF6_MICM2|nr:GNAT family N-acetyltransferase [Microscilla marina]EAY31958.1 acetyltransferase, gnat family [Microscilla marina ATCC 23134]
MKNVLTIREGTVDEVVQLSKQIPEFVNPHQALEYQQRLSNVPHLILVACDATLPVGFKVGYQRASDGTFYSWMGAVLPAYRHKEVATQLAHQQESWAKQQGYTHIRFKTRNRLKGMLIFALKNGFDIIRIEHQPTREEHRIVLEKRL